MARDTEFTGHPVLHLWVRSTAPDGDFFASLADVAPDGRVTPLPGTEDGQLRAFLRALNKAPYDNLGLPYHRAYKADEKPLVPGRATPLAFSIWRRCHGCFGPGIGCGW
jgi:predicted acyl esterase